MSTMKKIVIIDDDQSVLDVVEMVLSAEGYIVLTASNGEAGIELVKKEKPHLIILDVTMPKMNGYMVASLLSQKKPEKSIPVLLLTGTAQMAGGISFNTPGVQRKLSKPFDYNELLEIINEMALST